MNQIPAVWRWALGLLAGCQGFLWWDHWLPLEVLWLCLLLTVVALRRDYAGCAGLLLAPVLLSVHLIKLESALPTFAEAAHPVKLVGHIVDVQPGESAQQVRLKVQDCLRLDDEQACLAHWLRQPIVRITWRHTQSPVVGEVWQLETRLQPLRWSRHLGQPSRLDWQYAQLHLARAFVGEATPIERLQPAQGLIAWRQQLIDRLNQSTDPSTLGRNLYLALALGEQQAVTREQWQILQATGTVHLWVISGLHLGLLAGGVLFLVRLTHLPRGLGVLLAAGVVVFYAALSGWGVAAQRATLMLLIFLLVYSGWRRISPWTGLALAASALILLNPWVLTLRGFWLSFSAVSILILGLSGQSRTTWIWNLVRVQWLLFCALTPFLIWQGAQWSLWAPLVNLLMVPVIAGVILPLALLSLLELIWLPSAGLAQWVMVLLGFIESGLRTVSEWPQPRLQQPAFLWLGLLALCPVGCFGRYWAGLGLLLALLPPPASSLEQDGSTWQVWVLDVGQGTAVLVHSQGQYLLYDTGPGQRSDWAMILPALAGVRHQKGLTNEPYWIDYLVISHDDQDHRGGLAALLSQWSIGLHLSPAIAVFIEQQYQPVTHQACFAGQRWSLGTLDVLALWPPAPVAGRVDNQDSCVLLLRGGGYSLLLTGDAGWSEEAFFAQALPELLPEGLTLLLTGHHGSRHSTSPALLRLALPQWAIHTSGWRNAYGHPHASVQARLYEAGVQQVDTGHNGALVFSLSPEGLQQYSRPSPRLYWWLRI